MANHSTETRRWPPSLPSNFLALPPKQSSLHASKVTLLPVPYDATASYRGGARQGPRAIISASQELEDYDLELSYEPCAAGIHTTADLEPHAAGPSWMANRVAAAVGTYLDQGKIVGLLGGEHSITIGAITAAGQRFPELSVLYLDAHADFRDSYQGSAFSHACTARRIQETCSPVLVGVRSVSSEERLALKRLKTPIFHRGPNPLVDETYAHILQHLSDQVYISVDLDVLDPSIMPAVGNPEPGGLGWWELLGLLRAVSKQSHIIGFDVTELSPREGQETSAYTAAKLVYKLIGYSLQCQDNVKPAGHFPKAIPHHRTRKQP